jgi:hypothetical protein
MSVEGELSIALTLRAGIVADVAIESTRPHVARQMLSGKSADEALARVPSLFSICARSQAVAAQLAIAAARGQAPSAEADARHAQTIEAEMAQEYLWRALIDWPKATGGAPDTAALAAAREAVQQGAAASALRAVVEQQVLAEPVDEWLDSHVAGFEIWIARCTTAAARLLGDVQRDGPRHGASSIALLPPFSRVNTALSIIEGLQRDADFERHPHLDGAPAETGALARLRQQPLVAALVGSYGNATLTRLVARVTELARLVAGRRPDTPVAGSRAVGPHAGIGWAETARGLLVHHVELDGERVRSWRIVAPTEWNFHPRGALAAGLRGAHVGSADELRRRAQWLIDALDPCVTCSLQVRDA